MPDADHSLYFHDNARLAAEHILAGPFGTRLRQIATVEDRDGDWGDLHIAVPADPMLSSGERVMLAVLLSIAPQGDMVRLDDLWRLDDASWDRVIGALFIARGRVLAGESAL